MRISSSAWRGKPQFCSRVAFCGKANLPVHAAYVCDLGLKMACIECITPPESTKSGCKTRLHEVLWFSSLRGRDVLGKFYGQATKGVRWMPWRQQAMKDAVSCEKLRGAANRL